MPVRCPICDRKLPDTEKSCPNCGTKFHILQKDLAKKQVVKKERRPIRFSVPKWVWFVFPSLLLTIAFVALCLGIPKLWDSPPQEPTAAEKSDPLPMDPYIPCDKEGLGLVVDGKLKMLHYQMTVETGIEAGNIADEVWSMDGSSYLCMTDTGSLALMRDANYDHIANNIYDFRISNDGTGLVYRTVRGLGQETLVYYDTEKHQGYLISDRTDVHSYAISPDGDTVVWLQYDATYTSLSLHQYDVEHTDSVIMERLDTNHRLYATSNGGRLIYYAYKDQEAMVFCLRDGKDSTLLCQSAYVPYFNQDHTQLLIYNGQKTLIFYEGSPAMDFYSGFLSPVLPDNTAVISSGICSSYPFQNFYGHVYDVSIVGNRKLIFLSDAKTKLELAQDIFAWKLSSTGDDLYFIQGEVLKRIPVNDPGAKAKTIAQTVDRSSFVLSADDQTLCYVSAGRAIFADAKTGRIQKEIAGPENYSHAASHFFFGGNGTIYYLQKQSALHVYEQKNGKLEDSTMDITLHISHIYTKGDYIILKTANNTDYILIDGWLQRMGHISETVSFASDSRL